MAICRQELHQKVDVIVCSEPAWSWPSAGHGGVIHAASRLAFLLLHLSTSPPLPQLHSFRLQRLWFRALQAGKEAVCQCRREDTLPANQNASRSGVTHYPFRLSGIRRLMPWRRVRAGKVGLPGGGFDGFSLTFSLQGPTEALACSG